MVAKSEKKGLEINFSFSKANRIRKKGEFKKVLANGRKFNSKSFNVLVCANDIKLARLGIIIKKKNIKKSVDRNRIKRKIREVFRKRKHLLSGLDIVFIAKRNGEKYELQKEIEHIFKIIEKNRKNAL